MSESSKVYMAKRLIQFMLAAVFAAAVAGCGHHKNVNPIANLDSKQPDKVLFDRAMQALADKKYDAARITLQTLINTYPDSEFIARAKLGVGDSWYLEGTTAALAQAEAEYKDFGTFFPNMPEAAEAQLKVAGIHYKEMEKPDRDFTHASRAQDEYRQLINQYPDSKLIPEAKARLREVQEVLAEREYLVGHQYFLRQSWAAAIARLKTLTDQYPLYSRADEALYELGQGFERQADALRAAKFDEKSQKKKEALLDYYNDSAATAYAKILVRYPVMNRSKEAKERLEALKRPVPLATPEAIALNKAEQESREQPGRWARLVRNMQKNPEVAQTTKVGEPALVDSKEWNATEMNHHALDLLSGKGDEGGGTVNIEAIKGKPPANDPIPHSVDPPTTPPASSGGVADPNAIPELKMENSGAGAGEAPKSAPAQVNEVQPPATQPQANSAGATTQADPASAPSATSSTPGQNKSSESSSKKKKKHLVPW